MRTEIPIMMPQEQKKADKRQRLQKQMAVYYVLTAYVCHGRKKDCDRLSGEYYCCVTVPGEEYFIIQ